MAVYKEPMRRNNRRNLKEVNMLGKDEVIQRLLDYGFIWNGNDWLEYGFYAPEYDRRGYLTKVEYEVFVDTRTLSAIIRPTIGDGRMSNFPHLTVGTLNDFFDTIEEYREGEEPFL